MPSGADLVVDTLDEYGVTHMFGNPGTTELPLVAAVPDSDLGYVLCLHEDVAVGAAAGYAAVRQGQTEGPPAVGVVNIHITPGLAHGLGNLYGAAMAGLPVVVTAGVHSTDFQHEEPKLAGDVVGMAEQFTKWAAEVKDPDALPAMLRRAFRTALSPPRGPAFLAFPVDVLMDDTDAQIQPVGPVPDAGDGDAAALDGVAEMLADAEDIALVVGDHAANATAASEAAVRLAETTGARVHTEMLTSAVAFPFEHERFDSPLLPDERAAEQMAADALVWVGCTTNTTLTSHERPLVEPETTVIHLGADATELGKTVPVDGAAVGDPAALMAGLADRLATHDAAPAPKTRWATEYAPSEPVTPDGEGRPTPAAAIRGVRAGAPDALVVDESSSNKYEAFRQWPFGPGQYLGNKGAGLGYGLPVAVGAALAEREGGTGRPVVCLIGDGSYLYYPQSMYTATRLDLDLRVAVLDNAQYRILKENTAAMLGGAVDDYEFVGADFEPPVDVAGTAGAYGADTRVLESANAVADAAAEPGPRVLDIRLADYRSG